MADFFGTALMSNRYKKGKLNLNANENDLTSAICFVKKEAFDKIGGFNLNLFPGEDSEFFSRAKKAGFKIAYTPDIFIYHRRRPTIRLLWKQFYNYGYTRVKKEREEKQGIKFLYFLPSFFLIYLIFAIPFAFYHEASLIPIIIYLFLVLLSSLKQTIKFNDIKAIFLLPFIYPVIHLSYGYGLLKGLIRV
ncbi:hypothetical protein HYX16_02220 [Candidatus Woesearchaeota archaeon]|nr:hypothetical protein [Candidatus Woesearchaeota archaeon]